MTALESSADYKGTLGRYALFGEIASGGMAAVHVARLIGSAGFARTVAIKRLHPHLAKDPDFVAMFLEEARLAVRVRHPNVITTLDVVSEDAELFLVMEYLAGESLSRLLRKWREAGQSVSHRHLGAIMCGVLDGLHAAHEAKSDRGEPLGIVHRDVSPQNIHVGIDGVARVLDFGIAKATNRVQESRTDQVKGKVSYMSPEQLARGPIDRRADVFSASVVLWEALTGVKLFKNEELPVLVYAIMNDEVVPPSKLAPDVTPELDAIVMRGLHRDPGARWPSAREMAIALEDVLGTAPPREIGVGVETAAGDALAARIELVQRVEAETSSSIPAPLLRAHVSDELEIASGVVKSNPMDAPPPIAEPGAPKLPPVATAPPGVLSRSWLVLVALALLLLGGGFVAFRLVQLEEATPARRAAEPPPPEPAAEPAIRVELARTASAAAPPPPPPPAVTARPRIPEPKPTGNPKHL